MSLQLSREEARRFLTTYHFRPTTVSGVFERLGTVQYDPLNPVGRNPDLVLQARVPGYRFDDWQKAAYIDRIIYDGWDKQACLIPVSDWPLRARIREMHRPYHDREILEAEPGTAEKILAEIDARGPLSSLEFEDSVRYKGESWYGSTRTKRVLRSLWACGLLLTHHRKGGRHYYARPEQVIPSEHYKREPLLDEEAYYRWISGRRYQAVGLLRPSGEAAIWMACGDGQQRKRALNQLVEEKYLTPIRIHEVAGTFYMPSSALPILNEPLPPARVIFLGPLDSLLWDRKATQQIFDFEYLWEVYKPLHLRRWGYYVLPVFYKDRFIGRLDSRLEGDTWKIANWWWEDDIKPGARTLGALRKASQTFIQYLGASSIAVADAVDPRVKEAMEM